MPVKVALHPHACSHGGVRAPGLFVQLEVRLEPAGYPNGLPTIQCRVDVDNVMVGGETKVKSAVCRVDASDSDIKRSLIKASDGSFVAAPAQQPVVDAGQ